MNTVSDIESPPLSFKSNLRIVLSLRPSTTSIYSHIKTNTLSNADGKGLVCSLGKI